MRTLSYERPSASLGLQNASSWLLKKPNELSDGRNIRFNEEIGTYVRRNGYVTEGVQVSTTKLPCGAHTANFTTGVKRLVAVDNDAGTFCLVRSQNSDGTWTTIISDIPAESDVHFVTYRDEVYVSGFIKATGVPFQPYNIDKTLAVSQTHNLLNASWPAYFATYQGVLYAANVINGTDRYPDRFYKSSAPTGAFTFVQGAQANVATSVTLVNNVPLMTSNTAPTGVASASTTNGANAAWKAMDSDKTTFWQATATTGTLQYDFGAGVTPIVTYYAITGGSTISLGPTRSPKTWIFQGSNNGSTWTDIDTQTTVPVFGVGETRTYPATNTTAYRYYRLNITANQSDPTNLDVVEFAMYTSTLGVKPFQLKLDSVRYAKPGMNLDLYKAGTSTLLYTVNVYAVDKPNNIIQFLPANWAISSVDTAANTLTISSTASMPTGTPINFSATTTLPAPLVTGTQYYAINVTTTTIKVATSLANATIGQAIDITSAGSGTNTANLSYILSNNDEVYLTGTYGELSTLWNTDYPTPDKADWSAMQAGVDASNAITAILESNNRLFVFGLNSGSKFDGNTTIPFNSTVGCVGQRTLKNIDDDWLIWCSARGRVYARAESSGQQQYISRGIANKLLKQISKTQLVSDASAGTTDNEYILYVGNFQGEPTRVIYDFGSNTWAIDALHHPHMMYINDVPAIGKPDAGFIKQYFLSNDGYLYQDNTGDFDGVIANPIRFLANYGKTNYGSENFKKFIGCFVYSQNAQGLKVYGSIDNGEKLILGQVSELGGTAILYPVRGSAIPPEGSTIDITIAGAINGPPQTIESFIDYYNFADTLVGYGKSS